MGSALLAYGQSKQGAVGYAHVMLPVRNLTTSLPFYSTVLGLRIVAVPSGLASSQAWFDVGGGQQVRLVESKVESGNTIHIGLLVSSLRRIEQQCRQRNLPVSSLGKNSLVVTDPDGYQIELAEGKREGPSFLQSAAKTLWKSITTVE